jgi:hypothetical protein
MNNRIKKMRAPAPPGQGLSLDDLVQLNSRVPVGMKFAVKNSTKMAGMDLEIVMQDALKMYFGVQDDPMIEVRREAVMRAFKTLHGGRRPFEMPLTPQ